MIDLVTITGADDGVEPRDLVALSEDYPFVEWGVLFSLKRMGSPRYPSLAWFWRLGDAMEHAGVNPNLSLHVCGAEARAVLAGKRRLIEPVPSFGFDRMQLNGYTSPMSLSFRQAAIEMGTRLEFILQARGVDVFDETISDAWKIPSSSVLYDPSGGRGVEVTDIPEAPRSVLRCGLAGGIGPDNVGLMYERAKLGGYSWIDMESGVRTDDRFDLAKVRSVLDTCTRLRLRVAR